MPSKRPHLKSRSGCLACKRSHRKCDESIPVCSHCKRTGQNCRRDLLMRLYGSKKGEFAGIESQSARPTTESLLQDFTFDDLGLMHLFTTTTYLSVAASDPTQQYAWQILVPKEAQTHPYLMHSLLSLSALHRVQLEDRKESQSLERAINHHDLALSESKKPLAHLSEHNSSSLFALSILTGIFALGLPISPASLPFRDAIGQITQVAILMRGAMAIVSSQSKSIAKGPMAAMLRANFSKNSAVLPDELETSLTQLEAKLCSAENVEQGYAPYHETVQGLKACFRNTGFSADAPNGAPVEDQLIALSWLGVMHLDFVQLLSRRRSVALVLLSYYGIALHTLDSMWWCQGWGAMLVKEVYDSLDGTWRASMEWPIRQISRKSDQIAGLFA